MRRFYHTVDAMLQLCFGTEQQGLAVVARINAIHDRVKGELSEATGAFAAGTPYSAHDPALLAWVHATLLEMNLRVYELYVGPLSIGEKDRYCAEATAIEPALGIPRGTLPRNFGELGQYMESMLSSAEITVTDTARTLAGSILYPESPRMAQPVLWVVRLTTAGLLPPVVRNGYGISWTPQKQTMLFLSAGLIRNLLRLTPGLVRHWPAARRAHRRDRRSNDG